MFISLGFACRVRESIDRFNGFRVETNFFDWIFSNFSTVLFIIQRINFPEQFLTADKFIHKGIGSNNITHYTVDHSQLFLSSLHDFPSNMSYEDYMPEFLDKYKRRLERLNNIIITNKERIHFIHMIAFPNSIPTIAEVYYFIIAIKHINPNCNYYLHFFIPPELYEHHEKINTLVICRNVKVHYLSSTNKDQPVNEQRLDLNWNDIYKNISYHYPN
jgi:hypothetical protein